MPIEVKGLEQLRTRLDRLRKASRTPQVLIDLPETEEQKVEWIVEGREDKDGKVIQKPRDILQTTPKMLSEMAAAFAKGLAKTVAGASPDTPWKAAGEIYLSYLQKRIGFSGGDIASKLAPLKPSTIARKKGNTRRFYDSGDLLKAIMKAKVRVAR